MVNVSFYPVCDKFVAMRHHGVQLLKLCWEINPRVSQQSGQTKLILRTANWNCEAKGIDSMPFMTGNIVSKRLCKFFCNFELAFVFFTPTTVETGTGYQIIGRKGIFRWGNEKLILLYCPGRGSNSRPSAHRGFKHGQGVPRPYSLGHGGGMTWLIETSPPCTACSPSTLRQCRCEKQLA